MSDLILASTSPYRQALLERLNVPFRVEPSCVDEDAYKVRATDPVALAEKLAEAKALSLSDRWPEATIIGCDQLIAFDGRIQGKPGSLEATIDQLAARSGRSHELVTAMAVWHDGAIRRHTDISGFWMRPLSREEIRRYVMADRPYDCSGGYKIEQSGIVLFERIDSADHTAITGLPLIALTTILRDLGYAIP